MIRSLQIRRLLTAAVANIGSGFVRRGAALVEPQQCRFLSSAQSSTMLLYSSAAALPIQLDNDRPTTTTVSTRRNLSSYPQSGGGYPMSSSSSSSSMRAYPTYTVFGETCLLSVKFSMPAFKILPKSNSLVVDGNRRGRILLEWTPRTPDGRTNREGQIRFSLSPEEVGLLLDQLPENPIELSRTMFAIPPGGVQPPSYNTPEVGAEKVFRITSGETPRSLKFRIDFEKNGIGGQPQPQQPSFSSSDHHDNYAGTVQGPLDVEVQAGEYQVIKSLLETTLPYMTGWSTQLDIAMDHAMEQAIRQQGGGGGYNNGGGGFYNE